MAKVVGILGVLVTVVIFGTILLLPATVSAGDQQAESSFDIPRGAWSRTIGDIPVGTASNDVNRGIALGGFGAGAFMYNFSGSFGPWVDEIGDYNPMRLPGAAFHIYEDNGGTTTVKCLAVDTMYASTWDKIAIGDGTYYALQPRGWAVYNCFASEVESQFFSPIIPHNYRETSYPVAVWQFALSNPTAVETEISVMLTWPNPPFNGGNLPRSGSFISPTTAPGKTGIVLKCSDPANPAETENSEWCIASETLNGDAQISYRTWDPGGDGSDVWDDFAADGKLSNQVNPFDSAAAIAVSVTLAPGESRLIPIVLSWDFPIVEFTRELNGGGSTQWWKRYTEYFDTLSDNSFAIAAEALDNHQSWLDQIDNWQAEYYGDPRFPDWLITSAFNELYYNQFGGSFWEAGLRSGHPEEYLGLHEDDHKNFIMESMVYTLSGNISVGHYSSIVYAQFWPEMEYDLLRTHADIILNYTDCDPTLLHQTAAEIGAPRDFTSQGYCFSGDPFFAPDPHDYFSRAAPCEPGLSHVETDMSAKFIQRCWRYYSLYQDRQFLEYVWPAACSTYQFMKQYDCEAEPKDSLPDIHGYDNTYDGWSMHGTDIYSGGFWVGALQALDTMAAILDDPIRTDVQAWLEAAQRNLDNELWDPVEEYYHIDTESDYPEAVFADALAGQRYNEMYGLPDILPDWKMQAHLQKVYDVCVAPNTDIGARLGRMPDGTKVPTDDRDTYEYWVGTTYYLAATMYRMGMTTEALTTAYGAYRSVWADDNLAYWFNTPEAWIDGGVSPRPGGVYPLLSSPPGYNPEQPTAKISTGLLAKQQYPFNPAPHQYQRPRAVWELVFTMKDAPPAIPDLYKPENIAYVVDSTPTFHWSTTVTSGGTYELEYARDANFTIEVYTVFGLTDTLYNVPAEESLSDGVWFWHVEAIDAQGKLSGFQSEAYSFSVDADNPCNCTDLGDYDGDGNINPVDVVFMVKYVYKNDETPPVELPYCPTVNGDWNCDVLINPIDVVFMVNYVYKNYDSLCNPCE